MIRDAALGVSGLAAGRARYLRALTTLTRLLALYLRPGKPLADRHRQGAAMTVQLCRRNGAFWVKAAQFFSCRADVLPAQYLEAFAQLQNNAQPASFTAINKVLVKSWGDDWRQQFSSFDESPVAVASIAQVHHAMLSDGRPVAVKVRLPGVKRRFEQDGKLFKALAAIAGPRIQAFDVGQAVAQLLAMTALELDFRNEAANTLRFARQPHHPRIRIPLLVKGMCCERVLVTGWEEGTRLPDYLDKNPGDASELLSVLLTSYLQQVTRFGIYQADPHPGNFLVNAAAELVIVDFGAIGVLTATEVQRYSRLLYGLMGFEGEVDVGELFYQAGFRGGSPETLRQLALYVLTDMTSQQGMMASMGKLMEQFRQERITIPDSYIGISRVLITLGGFLMRYQVPLDWRPPEMRALS